MTKRPYIGKSDSQANADALARRSATYADENRASWELRMDRAAHEPKTLRQYVHELTKAYQSETEILRLHGRDLDAGGAPEWTPKFAGYLTASDRATDGEDNFLTPFRSALDSLLSHPDETMRTRGVIVRGLVVGGEPENLVCHVWHPFERVVALSACRTMWRSMSDVRIVTRRREAA